MKELRTEAKTDNLESVLAFIDGELEGMGCSFKTQTKIDVSVEEIFVNIAHYAYQGSTGDVVISVDVAEDKGSVTIKFCDEGIPYDPLAKEDPDVKASLEDRPVGGLGIFMAKKAMDSMDYEYRDGRNILSMSKKLTE